MTTREEFERFMASQRRGYDSSTPSFSYDDFLRFMSAPQSQHVQGNASGEAAPSTSANPDTQGSGTITLASVDDLLLAPGRNNLTYLRPDREGGATWFKHDTEGKITKQILKMLKSDLPGPYPTYRSLPQDVKNRWFRAFAQEFNWDPSITETVRTSYDKQAQNSFKHNLHEWKKQWKTKPDNMPEWLQARDSLLRGYIRLWTDEKMAKRASKNSKNRKSDRGGLGIAKHNTGSKTYERRWDEMTVEAGGTYPNMVTFMEDVYSNKKTGEIPDKKAKKILETVKAKVDETASQRQTQGDSVDSNPLTQEEINSLVLQEVPKVKGRRFGFGTLLEYGCTPSSFIPRNSIQEEKLREANEKILEQDAQIQYLMKCNKLLLEKFPDLRPLVPPPSVPREDEDETQE